MDIILSVFAVLAGFACLIALLMADAKERTKRKLRVDITTTELSDEGNS